MTDTKIVVDCSTGETTVVTLTSEEIAQREADAQAAATAAAEAEAKAAQDAAAKDALAAGAHNTHQRYGLDGHHNYL